MARETPSWTPVIGVAIVVVLVAAGLGAYVYLQHLPKAPPSSRAVVAGDNVTVNYIGVMGSGPEAGKVFDTSIYAVATDNVAYPKTLEFGLRGSAKNYTPLAVHVGGHTPQSGYSLGGLSFIQVVTGFWQGLIGLPGNSTRTVPVPPALGYGPTNPTCVATRPLSFAQPVVSTLTVAQFNLRYPGMTVALGTQFPDPRFGWPVLIVNANSSSVTVENLASAGMSSSPAGWPVVVTNVASTPNGTGVISLSNELTPAEAGLVLGHDYTGTGPCSSQSQGRFIVTAVDLGRGTYTENFNTEVQGQTLIFIVTVVSIFHPGPAGTLV